MAASIEDSTTTGTGLSYVVIARSVNGDTQYGIDGDVTNQVYSCSNSNAFPGAVLVAADVAEVTGAGNIEFVNDFDTDGDPTTAADAAGCAVGAPAVVWSAVQ